MLPFPALSPAGRASRAEEFTGISGEKENNLIKGPWSQAHGETGLVGFFSFNQHQVDVIFREVMILKIKGGGERAKHLQIYGAESHQLLSWSFRKSSELSELRFEWCVGLRMRYFTQCISAVLLF